jgi:glyoxylase I family protein
MPLFTGIDHPAMSCQDARKLADWYCTHLGMTVIAKNDETPPSYVLGFGKTCSDAGGLLELMPIKHPGGPKPTDVPRFCQGLRHFAIRVSNFDKAYQQLKDAGVTFLFEPVQAVGGGKIVSFRDPEGNEVQIVER